MKEKIKNGSRGYFEDEKVILRKDCQHKQKSDSLNKMLDEMQEIQYKIGGIWNKIARYKYFGEKL